MRTFLPHLTPLLHAFRAAPSSLAEVSDDTWIVAPAATGSRRAAFFLDGQLDRVRGIQEHTTFEHELQRIRAGEVRHGATLAYLLRGALLYGGTLYKDKHRQPLVRRSVRNWACPIPSFSSRASLGATSFGARYFAHFLMDDCTLRRALSEDPGAFGEVHTPVRLYSSHEHEYAALLGLLGERPVQTGFYDQLVVLDDRGQNPFKRQRYEWIRNQLFASVGLPEEPSSHPGVFLVRGTSGARRFLINEAELAERLACTRGFRVVNPLEMSVPEIVRACAGARCVVGVEGSALVHALLLLRPGAHLVCLEPPTRFNNVYKDQADCLDLNYGFVVGLLRGEDFFVPDDDLERTLDLLPP